MPDNPATGPRPDLRADDPRRRGQNLRRLWQKRGSPDGPRVVRRRSRSSSSASPGFPISGNATSLGIFRPITASPTPRARITGPTIVYSSKSSRPIASPSSATPSSGANMFPADKTFSSFLNAETASERFANVGLNGAHPLALAGLVRNYAGNVKNRPVDPALQSALDELPGARPAVRCGRGVQPPPARAAVRAAHRRLQSAAVAAAEHRCRS